MVAVVKGFSTIKNSAWYVTRLFCVSLILFVCDTCCTTFSCTTQVRNMMHDFLLRHILEATTSFFGVTSTYLLIQLWKLEGWIPVPYLSLLNWWIIDYRINDIIYSTVNTVVRMCVLTWATRLLVPKFATFHRVRSQIILPNSKYFSIAIL